MSDHEVNTSTESGQVPVSDESASRSSIGNPVMLAGSTRVSACRGPRPSTGTAKASCGRWWLATRRSTSGSWAAKAGEDGF